MCGLQLVVNLRQWREKAMFHVATEEMQNWFQGWWRGFKEGNPQATNALCCLVSPLSKFAYNPFRAPLCHIHLCSLWPMRLITKLSPRVRTTPGLHFSWVKYPLLSKRSCTHILSMHTSIHYLHTCTHCTTHTMHTHQALRFYAVLWMTFHWHIQLDTCNC